MKHRKSFPMLRFCRIIIEEDGWVWVQNMNERHEMGLGDIDVDVEIIDKRNK